MRCCAAANCYSQCALATLPAWTHTKTDPSSNLNLTALRTERGFHTKSLQNHHAGATLLLLAFFFLMKKHTKAIKISRTTTPATTQPTIKPTSELGGALGGGAT